MASRLILAAFLVVAAAGCSSSPEPAVPDVPPMAPALTADCLGTDAVAAPGSACLHVLDPTERRDREASIAVHPTDAATILVTWREGEFSAGPRVYAAITTDGGGSWTTTHLTDPDLQSYPGDNRYSFDSIARFGPDGTAYVLFGGELSTAAETVPVMDRMTVASSGDHGATWAYSRLHEVPGLVFAPDYMDLAIAPDTGHLYVTANMLAVVLPLCVAGLPGCVASEGVWVYRSLDGGATWELPTQVHRNEPVGVACVHYHYLSRLEAGPDGLVTMSTNGCGPGAFGGYVTVSRDDAVSWGEPVLVHVYDGGTIHDPVVVSTAGGVVTMHAVYSDGNGLVGYSSSDGLVWEGPVELGDYPEGLDHVWLGAAAAPDGAVYAQARIGSEDRFVIHVVRWQGSDVRPFTVVDAAVDGTWVVGDDYGAVAAAPDGSAWLAFSDLRQAPNETVAVAHLLPT